jgi:hypothetical protein
MSARPASPPGPRSTAAQGVGPGASVGLFEVALACIAVAGICAEIWMWATYTGDDINTLAPVARHSLMSTIVYYIRPIEYFVVQGANRTWLPLWLVGSALACVAAATVHLHTVQLITGRTFDRAVGLAIIAGSPVWFYAISQVDTVSQSLCNLAFAGALYSLVRLLQAPERDDAERWYVALNILSSLLLFTKELAIGAACILPAIGLWLYFRQRRFKIGYCASAVLFALSLAGWVALKIAFRSQMPEASGHYNLSPSLVDIARNSVASLAFGVTPLPTSLLSIARLSVLWTVCGSAAALAVLWAGSRMGWRTAAVRWWGLAMLGSCAPMFYVHASELYASMLGTLLVGIVVAEFRFSRWATFAYAAALLTCSYINAFVYYHGAELARAGVERALYSVYFGPNGQSFPKHAGDLDCPVGRTANVSFDDGVLFCHDADGNLIQAFRRRSSGHAVERGEP